MNDIFTLMRIELLSLFGINKFRHTRDKKQKRQYMLLAGAVVFVLLVLMGYICGLVFALCTLGIADAVPTYLAVLATLLLFFFGIFKAGSTLFGSRGFDILSALPQKSYALPLSRLAVMYIEDIAFTLLIMLPGLGAFAILQAPAWSFYLVAIVGILLIPLIPLAVTSLIGTLITALSSRFGHKSAVQTFLSLVPVIAVLVLPFGMQGATEDFSTEKISAMLESLSESLERLYAPAAYFSDALLGKAFLGLIPFAALSVGCALLLAIAVSLSFTKIMHRLGSIRARHDYKITNMSARGLWKSLYVREFKQYFSSSIYVTNTITGPIMGCVLAASVCVLEKDKLGEAIPFDIAPLIPFALSGVFCMMVTTSVAISIEGKQIALIKSLPISTKAWLDAKILLSLSLMLPFYIVSEVMLLIALAPAPIQLVRVITVPALIMLFSAVLGITVNLKFRRFDWEKQAEVVKQGASAALGGFAGPLLSVALGAVSLAVPTSFAIYYDIAICLLLALATWGLYEKNNKADIARL